MMKKQLLIIKSKKDRYCILFSLYVVDITIT